MEGLRVIIGHLERGFSLVEILIGLFIVSLTAANISALQQIVCDQSRDNFHHTAVIALVSEHLEQVMQYDDVQDVDALNGTTSSFTERETSFDLSWCITPIVTPSAAEVRNISITINWIDAVGATQGFSSDIIYYAEGGR